MPLAEKLSRYWDQDRSLTALLVLLGLNILVLSPAARLGSVIAPLAQWSLILLLAAGILAMGRGAYRVIALVFLLVTILFRLSNFVDDAPWSNVAGLAFASGTQVFIIYGVALMVNAEGPVTGHRIRGAVALYLLIAAFFSTLYALLELTRPGAFRFSSGAGLDPAQLTDTLGYFSCVTLTTVGYGDVTAV
ncbi:MAG: ion channel, partial [Verrucomicrobiota bacterium]